MSSEFCGKNDIQRLDMVSAIPMYKLSTEPANFVAYSVNKSSIARFGVFNSYLPSLAFAHLSNNIPVKPFFGSSESKFLLPKYKIEKRFSIVSSMRRSVSQLSPNSLDAIV